MSWFAKIEQRCAAFIEHAFASMFPSDVEPAHIARRLVAAMEARTQKNGAVMTAPGRYAVAVNPADFARLSQHREYLEREWAALIADIAGRAGIRLEGAANVVMREDAGIAPGAMDISVALASPAPAAVAFLVGPYRVDGPASVGRSAGCDIVLADPSVSRQHAQLDIRDGALVVRDAGSTNGTYVNGKPVQEASLRSGDVVSFGKKSLRVERPA